MWIESRALPNTVGTYANGGIIQSLLFKESFIIAKLRFTLSRFKKNAKVYGAIVSYYTFGGALNTAGTVDLASAKTVGKVQVISPGLVEMTLDTPIITEKGKYVALIISGVNCEVEIIPTNKLAGRTWPYHEYIFGRGTIDTSLTDINQNPTGVYRINSGGYFLTFDFYMLSATVLPPTFIEVPNENKVTLTKEKVNLSWTSSIDDKNKEVSYEVDYFNGIEWMNVVKDYSETAVVHVLPIAHTSNSKYRIRAKNKEHDMYSNYSYSEDFKTYRCIYLIKEVK